jgi:hypothetical protein
MSLGLQQIVCFYFNWVSKYVAPMSIGAFPCNALSIARHYEKSLALLLVLAPGFFIFIPLLLHNSQIGEYVAH